MDWRLGLVAGTQGEGVEGSLMAGDWIKMRHDLQTDPAVIAVASSLGIEEDLVVGKLHRFWTWADKHTVNGNAPGVTYSWLDRYLCVPGFAQALENASWLTHNGDCLIVPNFDSHISQSAKLRALTAKRVALHKLKKRVTHHALPREEKRREEKSSCPKGQETPLPPWPIELDSESFRQAWADWLRHRVEIRKPVKPTSQAAKLRELAAWGADRAEAAIRHSIGNGWQGIFEAKPDGLGPAGHIEGTKQSDLDFSGLEDGKGGRL